MRYSVSRSGNRVVIKNHVPRTGLRSICACLHQGIHEAGYRDITLDFSVCTGITESVMLPLIPIIASYRNDHVDFALVLPLDDALGRLFLNANWAHHVNPQQHLSASHEGGHVPALRFGDANAGDEIRDRVVDLILGQLEVDRRTLAAVEWSLSEIMDNVSNHANSPVGGFVQATAFKSNNRVEFVVADAGIGIPESMRIDDHAQALRQVIDEGVTRDSTANAGNGLYGSYRVASLSGGQFEINSLNGWLICDGSIDEVDTRREVIPYMGTAVRCSIDLTDSDLLANALKFKGTLHEPAFDYVERHFESDEGETVFAMAENARRDLGSRQGGIRVRRTIENLLAGGDSIAIDLSGIGVVSSSFADEVFGRLFVKMGPRAFMRRIEMRNVDPTVEGLIDRAIVQRTRLGNGND